LLIYCLWVIEANRDVVTSVTVPMIIQQADLISPVFHH